MGKVVDIGLPKPARCRVLLQELNNLEGDIRLARILIEKLTEDDRDGWEEFLLALENGLRNAQKAVEAEKKTRGVD